MRINSIRVKPVRDSINPEFEFELEVFIRRKIEMPLEISGCIFSEDNKKLGNIHEFIYIPNRRLELSAKDQNEQEEKHIIKLIAPLNQKVLDYIETLRSKNPKGDVKLNLDGFMRSINSKTTLSSMFLSDEKLPFELPKPYENAKPVFYKWNPGSRQNLQDMWILSGEGGSTFIEMVDINFKEEIIIPSSDWIHDYCPIFQIGRFLVFEYLIPECSKDLGDMGVRLRESIKAIGKMEDDILKGEWNSAIEDSRVIWELLRNENEIKDILMRDGYNEQAYTDLNKGIKSLFDYSAKFIHKLDRDTKDIMPDIKASKEDAYLIYSLSMNIVNLVSKKIQRQSALDQG